MGLLMHARNEKFFARFSNAGSNVVESAAILMEFVAAPHERWAELAKRLHDTQHVGDDTTSVGEPDEDGGQDETAAIDDGVLVVHLAMITPRTRPPLRLRHQRFNPSPRRLAEFC